MKSDIIKKGCIERAHVKPLDSETHRAKDDLQIDYDKLVKALEFALVPSKSSDAVSMESMKKVATQHAMAIWGKDIVCGTPLQLVDEDDKPIVYAFPCAIGQSDIPETKELLHKFAEIRKFSNVNDTFWDTGFDSIYIPDAVKEEAKRYGMIYVSAKKGCSPVTRVTYAIHPYFYLGVHSLLKAAPENAKLLKIRYIPPYEFFEIEANDSVFRLHTNTLMSEGQIRAALPKCDVPVDKKEGNKKQIDSREERVEAAWKAYDDAVKLNEKKAPLPFPGNFSYEFLIRHWERMPCINWTRWCEPTAASMVFSFWDHYVPVPGIGTYVGYERLVGYWFNHPSNGNNVPDILDPIADQINIDVANSKGYHWNVYKFIGNPNNDWGWDKLTAHLRTHRPLVWQIHGSIAHAVAAFGYRVVFPFWQGSTQKYVILYTTWSDDPDLAREEWLYNEYAGTTYSQVEIDRYVPGGAEPYQTMFLRRPYGSETYHINQWNEIRFYVHPQSNIKIARIEFSLDGGNTWQLLVECWTHANWNSWWWKPTQASTQARIRVKAFSETREYLAGDGSYKNFSIE